MRVALLWFGAAFPDNLSNIQWLLLTGSVFGILLRGFFYHPNELH